MIGTGLVTKSFGGLRFSNDGTKTTILGIAGDYLRIGDAYTTAYSLDSEDDLMVSGELEVYGVSHFRGIARFRNSGARLDNDVGLYFGSGAYDVTFKYLTADANALTIIGFVDVAADASNVPVFIWGDPSINMDLGLFDGVTQPILAVIEKDAKYAAVANATSTGANATLTTATAGTFTNAVVGDIVRVTAGTNATAGWYWITTVTDALNVVLDRTWCTGAVTGGTIVVYHDFTMLSADGICTRITDGAPDDNDIEINRAGWLILDVGQANGRLYWRVGNAWHYVDATAGLSLPANERVDKAGHKFELGDEVKLVIDKINDDGSFHAEPTFAGRN